MKHFFYLLILSVPYISTTQTTLRLEEIMKGHAFVGNLPSNHFWSWDSKRIYFDWNPENEPGNSTYYWESGLKEAKKLPDSELADTYLNDPLQADRKIRFYLKNGALFSFDTKTKTHRKLIHSSKPITKILPSAKHDQVFFQQDENLFRYNLSEHTMIQLTNFKSGTKPAKEDEENFLEEQQKELFQYIRDQDKKQKWNKEKTDRTKEKFPKAYYYGKSQLEEIQISPDEKFILFRLSDYPSDLETGFENFITSDGYAQEEKAREKVSVDAISKHQLAIYRLDNDSVYFVPFSSLSDIQKKPAYMSLYGNIEKTPSKDREIVMHPAIFNESGNACVIDLRSQDNKDRWIIRLDLYNGKFEELDHQQDAAWIGGPGISEWNFQPGTLGFLKDQESIYFQSEESGFSHLYELNITTKKKKQLTYGNWEVREIRFSKNRDCFYLSANKSHPGNQDYYKLELSTGKLIPILTENGFHDVQLSPDEKNLAINYSYKNKPWELYHAPNVLQAVKTKITHSTTPAFEAYQWREPEVISFEATDKTNIYARVYVPEKQARNGAAVIFVHGAGYLQNAHNYWSTYFREYLFHNLLCDQGYTVLDIDYRGSDGYGRDFRTGIYRYMGGLDLSDHLDGKKLLVSKYGIDSNRVGIYGGSYGGFITLMALLTKPGQFNCGAAIRSVTDWAHYNQEYTSNILNFPETDPEAYRKSSPIYFAENLKDPLLMLHGMVDDNVQFQDIVRISQRFIELGKKNWELAVFPVEAHGFKESYSWYDEYRRILELFDTNLLKR